MGDHKDKNDISFLLLKTCFFVQDSVKPTSHKEQEHERVVLKSNEYNMLKPKKKMQTVTHQGTWWCMSRANKHKQQFHSRQNNTSGYSDLQEVPNWKIERKQRNPEGHCIHTQTRSQ